MTTRTKRTLSTVLTAAAMLVLAVGFLPHGTAHAQTPGTGAAPAPTAVTGTTGTTSGVPAVPAVPSPTLVPTFPTVSAPPVPGMRFGRQNNHVVVCPPRLLAAATGGTGEVDMPTLLKNLKVNTADTKAYWFVPVDLAKITDRDDLDDRIEPNSTLLGGSTQVISMTAGTYYFGITHWNSDEEYLGVAPIVDGAVLTDLSEYATSMHCAAPAAAPVTNTNPVTTTTTTTTTATVAKPKKPLGKGGLGFSNLAMIQTALFAPENKSLLGLLGVLALALAAIPFSLAISAWAKRRQQLAITRAR